MYKTEERKFYNIRLANHGIYSINNEVTLEYIINRHNGLSSVTLDYEQLKSVGYMIDKQFLEMTSDIDRIGSAIRSNMNGDKLYYTSMPRSNNDFRNRIIQQFEVTKTGILDFIRLAFMDGNSVGVGRNVQFVIYRCKIEKRDETHLQFDTSRRQLAFIDTTINYQNYPG